MHYTVCSPQYMDYSYSYGEDAEPPEWTADCVSVEASTKREAKVLAVREMTKQGMGWVEDQRGDRKSPFTGLRVFEASCVHGNCWCEICQAKPDWVECEQCMEIWEREDAKNVIGSS